MIEAEITRNSNLGQVWTPPDIALQMAKMALQEAPNAKFVLDPACGPGTFSNALINAGGKGFHLTCYDVDAVMQDLTIEQNKMLGIEGNTLLADYLSDKSIAGGFDLAIMNPPYIRQEAISPSRKDGYHNYLSKYFDSNINRRSNLFVLFLLKSVIDLKSGGILCAIVYDAVVHTSYGKAALRLLDQHAKRLVCQPVKAPFDDVLVDAQILIYKKKPKPSDELKTVKSNLASGFVPLQQLLVSRRGTGFSPRKLFLAQSADPVFEHSEPIFVKQSKLTGLVVVSDQCAYLSKKDEKGKMKVNQWLVSRAEALGLSSSKNTPKGVKGPIVFNYYIRNAPRHLWNPKNVSISDNFYVSTPRSNFPGEAAWFLLNSEEYLARLCQGARSQGNGLLKLQLFEYQNIAVRDWRLIPKEEVTSITKLARSLITTNADRSTVKNLADKIVQELFDV